jgi:hypothetical protein
MTADQFGEHPSPCPQCGYDLRATALGGSCPECGLLIQAIRSRMRIEGKYLVVRSGTVFPARCIKTNAPVNESPINKTLSWVKPIWLLLILASGFRFFIFHPRVSKECHITYFMSRSERLKVWIRTVVSLLIIGVPVATLFTDAPVTQVTLIVTAVVSLVMVMAFARPIGVAKAKDGEFWIKGCGKAFLASIRAQTSLQQ